MKTKKENKKTSNTKLSKAKVCPYCGSSDIIYNKDEDELVCKACREIITKRT